MVGSPLRGHHPARGHLDDGFARDGSLTEPKVTERDTTTFHPGCTCRMGPADSTWAVVDDQFRVHGLQNLRVIGASIMPRMISANLNASTLMIADKVSDLIRGKSMAVG